MIPSSYRFSRLLAASLGYLGLLSAAAHGQTTTTYVSSSAFGGNEPVDLAFDGSGNMYVTGGNKVYKTPSGPGTTTVYATLSDDAYGITVDGNGNLYVAEPFAGNVVKIDTSLNVTTYGSSLGEPVGLAFDASGNLYVTNQNGGTDSVWEIPSGGGTPTPVVSGMTTPEYLAFDGSGNLYISDLSGGIDELSSGGSFSTYISEPTIENSDGVFPTYFWGVAFDASGNLYVDATGGQSLGLLKISPGPSINQITTVTPAGSGLKISSGYIYIATASNSIAKISLAAPTVTGVSPTTGSPGAAVTITGTGLRNATGVTFGTTPAASFTLGSDTSMTAHAPTGSGTVDITVTGVTGTSTTNSADQFTYNAAPLAPTVTYVNPSNGPMAGGTTVFLIGANFTGATAVKFGTTAVSSLNYTVDSPTQITVTSPAGSAATVDITVVTGNGTSATSSADQFTYVAPPTVTAVSPAVGLPSGGASVTITGTGFTTASAVAFGSAGTTFTIVSDTAITAPAPSGTLGQSVDVTVTSNYGTSTANSADQFTYEGAPTVTGVSPDYGPLAGSGVTITGTNFTGATAVHFGATLATNVTVSSSTQIVAHAPTGTGTVDATVTTPCGTSAISTADEYTYETTPAVTYVNPNAGSPSGGTTVFVEGTDFLGATAVDFGLAGATSFTVDSATEITATAPVGTGTVNITVTTSFGTSPAGTGNEFSFTAPAAPYVNSIGPASGPAAGGTSVTVLGGGFTGATAVKFGSLPATSFTVVNNNEITATSPPGGLGGADVTVTGPAGTSATNAQDVFSYAFVLGVFVPSTAGLSQPEGMTFDSSGNLYVANQGGFVSKVTPAGAASRYFSTAGGSDVVFDSSGNLYLAAAYQVLKITSSGGSSMFGPAFSGAAPDFGLAADSSGNIYVSNRSSNAITKINSAGTGYTFVPSTSFTLTQPAGLAFDSSGNLIVANVGTLSSNGFLGKVTPAGGGATTLNAGLSEPTFVAVDATGNFYTSDPADGAVWKIPVSGSITQLASVPDAYGLAFDATGNLYVSSAGGDTIYRLTIQPPAVTGISPGAGPTSGGASVTISGEYLSGATAVMFGPTAASSFTVLSDTAIMATAPVESAGPVDIQITTPNGTSAATSADQFTYVPAPTVTGVSPPAGSTAGGASVTIAGANFTGATRVMFGYAAATSFTVVSSTEITAVAPANAAGAQHVTVTVGNATSASSAADLFTFTSPPTVTAVSPKTGALAGGATVTLTGANLSNATAVEFGSVPAASFTVVSSTEITAVVPAGLSGTVNITVTTGDVFTSAASSADQFTTLSNPIVYGISPSRGPVAGGTTITITGAQLNGATGVMFGSVAAASFTVVSPTQVTATTPAGVAFSPAMDVTVTTNTGTSATSPADQFTYSWTQSVLAHFTSAPSAGGPAVYGLACDAAGDVYAALSNSNSVIKVSPQGQITTVVPSTAGLELPGGLALDSAGNLYIASYQNNTVFKLSTAGALSEFLPSSAEVFAPMDLAFDRSGNLHILSGPAYLVEVSPTGTVLSNAALIGPAGANVPNLAMAIDPSGNIDVAEESFSSSANAGTIFQIPSAGAINTLTSSAPDSPAFMAFDAAGNLFVTGDFAVRRITPQGSATTFANVTFASGIAFDATGNLFGADFYDGVIYQFSVQPPVVASVSPATGLASSATTVTITGRYLTGATAVDFGATPAGSFTVVSDTQITATVPAGLSSSGPLSIAVTTPNGVSIPTAAAQFTPTGFAITSALAVSGVYGTAISGYAVTADNSPTSFSATGLPPGLSINQQTGAITGAPTSTAGSPFHAAVTATGSGNSAQATVVFTIAPLPITVAGFTANNKAYDGTTAATINTAGETLPGVLPGDAGNVYVVPYIGRYGIFASASVGNDIVVTANIWVLEGAAAANYSLQPATTTANITPKPLTVTGLTASNKPADGTATATIVGTPSLVGVVGSDNVTLTGTPVGAFTQITPGTSIPLTVTGLALGGAAAGEYSLVEPMLSANITQNAATQAIVAVGAPGGDLTNSTPTFLLQATATSGLLINFQAQGPVQLGTTVLGLNGVSGVTVTPTGVAGDVIITATQAGNSNYLAAAPVTITFTIAASGSALIFFPTGVSTAGLSSAGRAQVQPDAQSFTWAAQISPNGSSGTLIGYIPGANEGFTFVFSPNVNGTFSATTTALTGGSTSGATLTLSGQITSTTISGTIEPLGLTFSSSADPSGGPSSNVSGIYLSAPGNGGTATYTIVGTQGEVYALAAGQGVVAGGAGTVSSNGSFIVTPIGGAAAITGSVSPSSGQESGTVSLSGGGSLSFTAAETAAAATPLMNISTLGEVESGQAMVAGFVIGGTGSKAVLLRAVGPTLATLGVSDSLADPVLQVYDGQGNKIGSNQGWGGTTALSSLFTQVGAFALPQASADSAVSLTLNPGAYSMDVTSAGGGAGMVLAEVYDAGADPQAEATPLVDISSLGFVSGTSVELTAGFVIQGNVDKQVLIRAVGPGLGALGVPSPLSGTVLTVLTTSGTVEAQNQGWDNSAEISATAAQVGAFPLATGSLDSAVLISLAPGSYSARVSGAGSAAGAALVEVYQVTP